MKATAKTRTPKPARRKPAEGAVAVNTELIGLYWRVGEYNSRKLHEFHQLAMPRSE